MGGEITDRTLNYVASLYKGMVYIPSSDAIKIQILRERHDSRAAGHLGHKNTFKQVSRDFYWPGMRRYVKDYVWSCETCARNKLVRHVPHGLLHPLPIPTNAWQSVSMDPITELPPLETYDAILVCVDRFTKMAHFIPTNSNVTAEQVASLYVKNVF